MDVVDVQQVVCQNCYALADVADRYCRCCGLPMSDRASHRPAGQPFSPLPRSLTQQLVWTGLGPRRASDSRAVVLVMLFLVLGPLALPLLWRSRGFSRRWKILLTVIVAGATAILLLALGYVLAQAAVELGQLRSFAGF